MAWNWRTKKRLKVARGSRTRRVTTNLWRRRRRPHRTKTFPSSWRRRRRGAVSIPTRTWKALRKNNLRKFTWNQPGIAAVERTTRTRRKWAGKFGTVRDCRWRRGKMQEQRMRDAQEKMRTRRGDRRRKMKRLRRKDWTSMKLKKGMKKSQQLKRWKMKKWKKRSWKVRSQKW